MHRTKILLALVTMTGFCGALASAQQEKDIEIRELRAALSAAVSKNRALESQVTGLTTVNRNLGESLRVANAEAEEFRRSYAEMRLQMEALGIEAVTDGPKGIEGKLARAANDIRLLEEQQQLMTDVLVGLSDAAMRFVETAVSSNAEARTAVEKAVADADKALGFTNVGRCSAHEIAGGIGVVE